MAETTTAFLKCPECRRPFAPNTVNRVTCSPACSAARREAKRVLRRAAKAAALAAVRHPCARAGCPETFAREHHNHKYCTPACARRVQDERHRDAKRARARDAAPAAAAAEPVPVRLRTPGELAATLAGLTTRRELDEFHRDAALCWCATEGAKAKTAIRALAIEARGRMQSL